MQPAFHPGQTSPHVLLETLKSINHIEFCPLPPKSKELNELHVKALVVTHLSYGWKLSAQCLGNRMLNTYQLSPNKTFLSINILFDSFLH